MSSTALTTVGGTSSSLIGTRFSSACNTASTLPSRAYTTDRSDNGRRDLARSSLAPLPAVKTAWASGTRRIAANATPTPAATIATPNRTSVRTARRYLGDGTSLVAGRGGSMFGTAQGGGTNLVRHWRVPRARTRCFSQHG